MSVLIEAICIPLRTGNGLNDRGHWRVRARRVTDERDVVQWTLCKHGRPRLPCVVTLTRVAPSRGMDDDNLPGALKSVRDEIARWFGVDDKHRHIVRYAYAQRTGPWGVEIQFAPMTQEVTA